VIARPPEHWFHGIDGAMFSLYREALVDLGVEIFEVPTDPFLLANQPEMDRLIVDLCAFRPQLAMGLPHGAYALLCQMAPDRTGYRPNFSPKLSTFPPFAGGTTRRSILPANSCSPLRPRRQTPSRGHTRPSAEP
jgi:hypothetical protein